MRTAVLDRTTRAHNALTLGPLTECSLLIEYHLFFVTMTGFWNRLSRNFPCDAPHIPPSVKLHSPCFVFLLRGARSNFPRPPRSQTDDTLLIILSFPYIRCCLLLTPPPMLVPPLFFLRFSRLAPTPWDFGLTATLVRCFTPLLATLPVWIFNECFFPPYPPPNPPP